MMSAMFGSNISPLQGFNNTIFPTSGYTRCYHIIALSELNKGLRAIYIKTLFSQTKIKSYAYLLHVLITHALLASPHKRPERPVT